MTEYLPTRPCNPGADSSPCKHCIERAAWCEALAEKHPRQRDLIRVCVRSSECVPHGTIWFSPFGVSCEAADADKAYIFERSPMWGNGGRYLFSGAQWRDQVVRYVETEEAGRKRNLVPRGALSLCEHDMEGTLMLYEGP